MVVLVAEAAAAVPETLADNVAGGVLAPPFRVAVGDHFGLLPAHDLSLGVEEPRSISFSLPLLVLAAMPRRRRVPHPSTPPPTRLPPSGTFALGGASVAQTL